MIVSDKDVQQLFLAISTESKGSTEKNVIVFQSINDVESVCACKLLSVSVKDPLHALFLK
jgi:hypothetical protein